MSFWGGIKRSPADAAFSDYIRERAEWKCEFPGCFKAFNPLDKAQRKGLHCSHFKTRSNKRIRFDEENAAAVCAYHHDFLGKNPDWHADFFMKRLGQAKYWALIVRGETRRSCRLDEKMERLRWLTAIKHLKSERGEIVIGTKA